MPELTQEQLDSMIASAVEAAKKGMYTEDELNRRITAEADRRVESGIQKGIETQKAKWIEQYKAEQGLTAEELADKKMKEFTSSLEEKERAILTKSNLLDAKERLSEVGVPKSHYEKLLSKLVTSDQESTKANIDDFISSYTAIKSELETTIKKEITKVPPAGTGGQTGTKKFKDMNAQERAEFKEKFPEQFDKELSDLETKNFF